MVAWPTSQTVTRRYGPATPSEPPSRPELPTIPWQLAGLLCTVTGAFGRCRAAGSRRPGDGCFRSLLGPDGLRPAVSGDSRHLARNADGRDSVRNQRPPSRYISLCSRDTIRVTG